MSAAVGIKVGRRGVRGIVVDDEGRLVLIKRTKPGQGPYWTSPGGGVEESDATVEDALRRELAEELGATADGYQQVFLASDPTDAGVAIQYFLLARLTSLNLTERYGSEFRKPERGGYDLDYVPLTDDSLGVIDLKTVVLKEFVLANRDALLAEAGFDRAVIPPDEVGRGGVSGEEVQVGGVRAERFPERDVSPGHLAWASSSNGFPNVGRQRSAGTDRT